MEFGIFTQAKLPSKHGGVKRNHYIYGLAQQIDLGYAREQPGQLVATYLEHYAVASRTFDPQKPSRIYVHYRDVVADLFLTGSGREPNVVQQILHRLDSENAMLLCIDSLSPYACRHFARQFGGRSPQQVSQQQVVHAFQERLGIRNATIVQTSSYDSTIYPKNITIATDVGHFSVRRHDEVVQKDFPAEALPHIFPNAVNAPPIYLKHRKHFLLLADGTDLENLKLRPHSSCETGDVLASLRCDCGDQFHQTMKNI
jgi:GTP cyclohydrolase II